jgi:hypothetical protein
VSITRINREAVEGESVSRDYEFLLTSIDRLIAQGYAIAVKTLERRGAVEVNGFRLAVGDGIAALEETDLTISATKDSEVILVVTA